MGNRTLLNLFECSLQHLLPHVLWLTPSKWLFLQISSGLGAWFGEAIELELVGRSRRAFTFDSFPLYHISSNARVDGNLPNCARFTAYKSQKEVGKSQLQFRLLPSHSTCMVSHTFKLVHVSILAQVSSELEPKRGDLSSESARERDVILNDLFSPMTPRRGSI